MPSAQPTVFVLFGATGDLAKRMVLPAFYQLAQHGLMPESWLLVGNGRGDIAHEDFRSRVSAIARRSSDLSNGATVRLTSMPIDSLAMPTSQVACGACVWMSFNSGIVTS